MQLLTDQLAQRILKFKSPTDEDSGPPHVSVRLNTAVESLTLERGDGPAKWVIKTGGSEALLADAVCLALPAHVSAHLLRSIEPEVASDLEGISYASSATINVAYKRADIPHPLNGFGFVVPSIEKRSLIACTFSSVKFAGRAPEGFVLLRVFVGGALQPELLELDDARLLALIAADLRDLLGVTAPPVFTEVARWRNSMPQYHLGHLGRVARIVERLATLPSLALAGNAYSGIGISDCIRSGETAADSILSSFVWLWPKAK
jgi:oxygen-dependent protoporphyrinogen oxidase